MTFRRHMLPFCERGGLAGKAQHRQIPTAPLRANLPVCWTVSRTAPQKAARASGGTGTLPPEYNSLLPTEIPMTTQQRPATPSIHTAHDAKAAFLDTYHREYET